MITKFTQSWELFKASITVTLRYRKLLWFPILTSILTVFIALFFLSALALPVVLHDTGYRLDQKEHWVALKKHYLPPPAVQAHAQRHADPKAALVRLLGGRAIDGMQAGAQNFPWGSLGLLALYLLSMFLATFFNVAFYSEIIAALNGRGVSFRRGLKVAWSRLPSILAWSLLAGVVGWLIRRIEERLPLVGRILAGLVGLAWSIAAVFVIPVIIQEQALRNPLKILQQSATTLKRTWGEGLIGYLGFSAGTAAIFACSLVPLLIAGALAYLLKRSLIIVVAAVLWVLALLLVNYVSSVAGHVYRCALYLYAAEGVVPQPYSQELLDRAWKVKE